MKLYTVGFTQKTAQQFFELLGRNKVTCVVDIRLHPDGQLAGFSKRDDLRYFLKQLIACDYQHIDELAPSEEVLKAYRADKDSKKFLEAFSALMQARDIPHALDRRLFEEKTCCLLCSEALAENCHRRIVAELLQRSWEGVEIIHL